MQYNSRILLGVLTWQCRPAIACVATKVVKLSIPRHGRLQCSPTSSSIETIRGSDCPLVLQSDTEATSGVDSPDRAKVARVNCGGTVRVVRDDVLLVHGGWSFGCETCSRS